jgi:uncharacterized protein YcbK (DUF882 family)
MRELNDFALSPHFKLFEFECRCCGRVMLATRLVVMLEDLRAALGRPVVITSGYRCHAHNKAIGGAPRSLHMLGRAVDIKSQAKQTELAEIKKIAAEIGFYEILPDTGKNYIHLSLRIAP